YGMTVIFLSLCDSNLTKKKSELLRKNAKRKIGFEEAQEIWNHYHIIDQRSDDPEQYRAIGW
ncbi:MAG: hypothetical protein LWW98_05940, partial [Deltaproteobacteria bacterium]|nr:hypothetical protein [Deltaproteobacteria bacterium]